jgi:hypothetical protein
MSWDIADELRVQQERLAAIQRVRQLYPGARHRSYGSQEVWVADIDETECDVLVLAESPGDPDSPVAVLAKKIGPGVLVAPRSGNIVRAASLLNHISARPELLRAVVEAVGFSHGLYGDLRQPRLDRERAVSALAWQEELHASSDPT